MKHLLLLFPIAFFSCKNPENHPTGGPCTYATDTLPATVIAIQPHDSLHSEVLFTVEKKPGKTDTLYYTKDLNGPFASDEDLKKYNIEEGEKFIYVRQRITYGTCTPEIYSLQMQKFRR